MSMRLFLDHSRPCKIRQNVTAACENVKSLVAIIRGINNGQKAIEIECWCDRQQRADIVDQRTNESNE